MDLNFMVMGEDEILEEVDEYLLYCLYLGFQPDLRVRYRSPVREKGNEDANASWSMFYNTSRLAREFAWKDSGTGVFGDIFKLVQLKFGLSSKTAAIERVKKDVICSQHGRQLLLSAGTAKTEVKSAPPACINIKSRDFDQEDLAWWKDRTSATEDVLKRFNISRVRYYWMLKDQLAPTFPGDRVYATRIYSHYHLYFPHRDKDRKFRNNFSDDDLPGFCQLAEQSETLIITKSIKDVVAMHMLGFEAVTPRGEHTPVPERFMQHFKTVYRNIFTLFDNDGKHRAWAYDCPSIEIPMHLPKDISDHHLKYGPEATKVLIESLIKNHPAMQIDMTKKMTRPEMEKFLEDMYLSKVITIQHVGKKINSVCGKIQRLAVDIDPAGEFICIVMIGDTRYEFAAGYFIQKAQIQEHGNSYTADQPG